jgi:hypothetical protein
MYTDTSRTSHQHTDTTRRCRRESQVRPACQKGPILVTAVAKIGIIEHGSETCVLEASGTDGVRDGPGVTVGVVDTAGTGLGVGMRDSSHGLHDLT